MIKSTALDKIQPFFFLSISFRYDSHAIFKSVLPKSEENCYREAKLLNNKRQEFFLTKVNGLNTFFSTWRKQYFFSTPQNKLIFSEFYRVLV